MRGRAGKIDSSTGFFDHDRVKTMSGGIFGRIAAFDPRLSTSGRRARSRCSPLRPARTRFPGRAHTLSMGLQARFALAPQRMIPTFASFRVRRQGPPPVEAQGARYSEANQRMIDR